jgi:hypothetical protein
MWPGMEMEAEVGRIMALGQPLAKKLMGPSFPHLN